MFKKVLIVEDHQKMNISLQETLKSFGIAAVKYAYYCDDALLALRHACSSEDAFDLLITDLSFLEDDRPQALKDGEALIRAARALQADLAVLVFSAERQPEVINGLFQELGINGYVAKSRRDEEELQQAIQTIFKKNRYIPVEFRTTARSKHLYDFSPLDVMIIHQLAKGTPQKNIPAYLREQGEKASSLSSVEKRLGHMRTVLGFTKNEQLIAYCKDRRII